MRRNGYLPHIVPRDAERHWLAKIPGYRARRWPVERTMCWQSRFRRLLARREKQVADYTAMAHLACASIAFRHVGPA